MIKPAVPLPVSFCQCSLSYIYGSLIRVESTFSKHVHNLRPAEQDVTGRRVEQLCATELLMSEAPSSKPPADWNWATGKRNGKPDAAPAKEDAEMKAEGPAEPEQQPAGEAK